ncbi:C6 finger domain protein [Penicillium macrosclerotiorum]|uniref:C6 finger domain protein n=1 Tax=Penicillium macrosclerotiorum TaxID=303699 RepID=UPI002547D331|nr:C6 finger domain protein [Penicillium macrosclerotiorum]KAJ5689648.1 C6 finger domain protein [Penicillium macrosclerotiorum]
MSTPAQSYTNPSISSGRRRIGPKQRISHTKSRKGCYTCKHRRVKCDEGRPKCGACAIRNDECVFPNLPVTRDQPQRRTGLERDERAVEVNQNGAQRDAQSVSFWHSQFNLSLGDSSSGIAAQRQGLNMHDLILLQHYFLHTSKRMSLQPSKTLIWERVIPEMAASNEFLMHLVLALAGLELLTAENPDEIRAKEPFGYFPKPNGTPGEDITLYSSRLHIVLEHHQQGLKGLQEELSSSDSNAEVLVAGAMLIVGFAFASLRVRDLDSFFQSSHASPATENTSPGIAGGLEAPQVQWLRLVRGLTAIMDQNWHSLRRSRIRSLLIFNNANDDWKIFESELRSTTPLGDIRSKRVSTFAMGAFQAISDLREFYAVLKGKHHTGTSLQASSTPIASPSSPHLINQSADHLLESCDEAINVTDTIYMRILHVLQMGKIESQPSSSLELQTEIEDAAVSSWARLLPDAFVSSLDVNGSLTKLQGLCMAILAHLYLTIAILEDIWYFGRSCDFEIQKINALVAELGNDKLTALLVWPMKVIEH